MNRYDLSTVDVMHVVDVHNVYIYIYIYIYVMYMLCDCVCLYVVDRCAFGHDGGGRRSYCQQLSLIAIINSY